MEARPLKKDWQRSGLNKPWTAPDFCLYVQYHLECGPPRCVGYQLKNLYSFQARVGRGRHPGVCWEAAQGPRDTKEHSWAFSRATSKENLPFMHHYNHLQNIISLVCIPTKWVTKMTGFGEMRSVAFRNRLCSMGFFRQTQNTTKHQLCTFIWW